MSYSSLFILSTLARSYRSVVYIGQKILQYFIQTVSYSLQVLTQTVYINQILQVLCQTLYVSQNVLHFLTNTSVCWPHFTALYLLCRSARGEKKKSQGEGGRRGREGVGEEEEVSCVRGVLHAWVLAPALPGCTSSRPPLRPSSLLAAAHAPFSLPLPTSINSNQLKYREELIRLSQMLRVLI